MPDVNLLAVAVAVAAVVAFVLSATYYMVLGDQLATVSEAAAGPAPPWTIAAELLRSLVVVAAVAGLASNTATVDWTGGVVLGLALWVGFPLVLWAGAIVHERTPLKLAAIHAGDWLIKLLVVTVIVSVWQ